MEASKNYPDSLPESPIWRESMDWPDTEFIHSQVREDLACLSEDCNKNWNAKMKEIMRKLVEAAGSDHWVTIEVDSANTEKQDIIPKNKPEKIKLTSWTYDGEFDNESIFGWYTIYMSNENQGRNVKYELFWLNNIWKDVKFNPKTNELEWRINTKPWKYPVLITITDEDTWERVSKYAIYTIKDYLGWEWKLSLGWIMAYDELKQWAEFWWYTLPEVSRAKWKKIEYFLLGTNLLWKDIKFNPETRELKWKITADIWEYELIYWAKDSTTWEMTVERLIYKVYKDSKKTKK